MLSSIARRGIQRSFLKQKSTSVSKLSKQFSTESVKMKEFKFGNVSIKANTNSKAFQAGKCWVDHNKDAYKWMNGSSLVFGVAGIAGFSAGIVSALTFEDGVNSLGMWEKYPILSHIGTYGAMTVVFTITGIAVAVVIGDLVIPLSVLALGNATVVGTAALPLAMAYEYITI